MWPPSFPYLLPSTHPPNTSPHFHLLLPSHLPNLLPYYPFPTHAHRIYALMATLHASHTHHHSYPHFLYLPNPPLSLLLSLIPPLKHHPTLVPKLPIFTNHFPFVPPCGPHSSHNHHIARTTHTATMEPT